MVRRKNLQTIDPIARRGAAATPSRSASQHDLKITYLAPARLHRSPRNARTHSEKQLQQIAKSIARFGFVNPVLISDDLEIVAGHGRVEAAKLLGLRKVPTVRLSKLSPADRRAYVIADNRLAELAGWDRELLAIELQGLLDLQIDDVEVTGFSLPEIELLLEDPADNKSQHNADQLPANSEPAVSKPGDVWVLGHHRLQCGEGDPLHCDLIVRRWQRSTGKAARLEGSDLSFADVKNRRA